MLPDDDERFNDMQLDALSFVLGDRGPVLKFRPAGIGGLAAASSIAATSLNISIILTEGGGRAGDLHTACINERYMERNRLFLLGRHLSFGTGSARNA